MSDPADILYQPREVTVAASRLADYLAWLARRGQAPTHNARDYDTLHAWSIAQPEAFWNSLWDYLGIIGKRGAAGLWKPRPCPGRAGPRGAIEFRRESAA